MADQSFPNHDEIEASQLEQLRSLAAELIPGNRFYSQKFGAAGITFDVASLKDYSARFPFTTKAELVADQERHSPFGTNLTYPLQRYVRYHQTSGTMGKPLRWLDTTESWDAMVESWMEIFRAAGVTAGDRVYFAFSFGPFIGFWLAFDSAARLGCLCIPGGGLTSAARMQTILDNGVTILCCTPTYAIRLGETAKEGGIELARLKVRTVVVAGEPGGSIPSIRKKIGELWRGASVFDHHGMTETGPVTYECPKQPGRLHVLESAFFAEIITPASGKSVQPGEIGELVLTTLARTGSPLLRYRTGDLVKGRLESGPCNCGRHELALEGGIIGRTDDMVVVKGVNIYPSAIEEIVRACRGVAEYEVVISQKQALAELALRIEAAPDCPDVSSLAGTLEKSFESALAMRVPVTLVPNGTLPRFEMKAKRWVRE
jgi:phenylacetate-CoA ligase